MRQARAAGYDARPVRWSLVVLVACAAPAARVAEPPAARVPPDADRSYAIWLGGARIGTAHEHEAWTRDGVTFVRSEAMQFLRGDAAVELATTIEIVADARLVPSRVTWRETSLRNERRGEAVRDPGGWRVTDDAGAHVLPAAAIPAELAPLRIRRDGAFAGPVFLPARGFAVGEGRIAPVDPPARPAGSAAAPTSPRRLIAWLAIDRAATAEATIDLGDDGMPVRVVDGEGVIATRISAAEAAQPITPVDVIAATAVAVTGRGARLALEGDLALPPVPGQRAERTADGAVLALSPRLPGNLPPGPAGADRTREITALVAQVRHRIAPDLAAEPGTPRTAADATAGDCTTFALAYTALATARAIPTLVVTGFRVDGARLIRHRWAVSWTGRAWIAVDAAFGAVPAGGDLVGLAVHDADDLGLVAGEAALTRVRAAAWQ